MAHLSFKEIRGMLLALVLAASLMVGGAYTIASQRNSRDKAICQQIELLKGALRLTLNRSLTTLPTLEYYQLHPQELKVATDRTHEALDTFKERACG